jgi:hydrogenase maturation protease
LSEPLDLLPHQAGNPRDGTRVLALGNPLRGDDGIGSAVLEALAQSGRMPPGVELLDGGTAGLETTLLLEGCRCAIIVDAANLERAPGEWARITSGDAALRPDDMHLGEAVHNAGLAEALALGKALDILPPELTIYAVQPLELGWSTGLSEPVRKAVPAVCAAILEEIQDPGSKDAKDDGKDSSH